MIPRKDWYMTVTRCCLLALSVLSVIFSVTFCLKESKYKLFGEAVLNSSVVKFKSPVSLMNQFFFRY